MAITMVMLACAMDMVYMAVCLLVSTTGLVARLQCVLKFG